MKTITTTKACTKQLLDKLQENISWAQMEVKSHSISIVKGWLTNDRFFIKGEPIPRSRTSPSKALDSGTAQTLKTLNRWNNSGWKYFKSSMYSISTVKMNWTVGRQHCRKSEADLVVINSKEEMIFVHGLISNLGAWLGLTDTENEGVWKWVDGKELTTSYWMKGQPNNGGRNGNDDCGVIVFGKAVLQSWNDNQCNYLSYVICEKSVA
ncbi:CD209 antigen-like protein C [Triplophysa rosa]|uniref:CD209 antigen-like protein C n=1 Tax=Triplophysa rosa TaxID=992332 RepID=UPI0025462265|nr:CD209 antigen-like protein C [Triplophysa rosa]